MLVAVQVHACSSTGTCLQRCMFKAHRATNAYVVTGFQINEQGARTFIPGTVIEGVWTCMKGCMKGVGHM